MIAGRNDDALRRFIFLVGHVAVSIRQLGNDAVDLAVSILGEHVAALVIIESNLQKRRGFAAVHCAVTVI